jgi:hypothetical protein
MRYDVLQSTRLVGSQQDPLQKMFALRLCFSVLAGELHTYMKPCNMELYRIHLLDILNNALDGSVISYKPENPFINFR